MRPPERPSLDALVADLRRSAEGAIEGAPGSGPGAEQDATERLLSVGIPLILVAMVRLAATSVGTDLLPPARDPSGSARGAPPDAVEEEAAALLDHLLGPRRSTVEATLERLAGMPRSPLRGALEAMALRIGALLANARERENLDARQLCRALGVALSRAEDAVPGAVGAFEELLEGEAPAPDDLVRIGRHLLEGFAGAPPASR